MDESTEPNGDEGLSRQDEGVGGSNGGGAGFDSQDIFRDFCEALILATPKKAKAFEVFREMLRDPKATSLELRKSARAVVRSVQRAFRLPQRGFEIDAGNGRPPNDELHALALLFADPSLLTRYLSHYPAAKRKLAQAVCEKYFSNPKVRCFVQASSLSIHLGEALARIATDCLFHTNSGFFPLAVLRGGRGNIVYPVGGDMFDDKCGGWLFASADHAATNYLTELFDRGNNPLTLGFIMPLAVTARGGVYYEREESARMARIVSEHAQHTVILATADRIYADVANLPKSEPWRQAFEWGSRNGRELSLLIAGKPIRGTPDEFQQHFGDRDIGVTWIALEETG